MKTPKAIVTEPIRVDIPRLTLQEAEFRFDCDGTYKGSIMKGRGAVIGFLGEEICLKQFSHLKRVDAYTHDLASNDGLKFEVKSKLQNVDRTPALDYTATIYETSRHQTPNIYLFTRIHQSMSHGWICGWITHEGFWMRADPRGQNNQDGAHTTFQKCWDIRIGELTPLYWHDQRCLVP